MPLSLETLNTKFQLKEGPTSQLSRQVSVLIAGKEVFSWLVLPMHIGRYIPTDTEFYTVTEQLQLQLWRSCNSTPLL